MSATNETVPPTLAQIIAIVVALRRLLVVVGLPPVLTVASPLLLSMWFSGVDLLTAGCGVITTVAVVLLTALGRSIIKAHAPSTKHASEALQKVQVILPLLSFVLVRMVILTLVLPASVQLGMSRYMKLTPIFNFAALLRLAASMAILGLSVAFRFMGPFSVVRCSSFPLVSHPWTVAIRSFLSKAKSMDALIDLVAKPTDETAQPSSGTQARGRRCQRPGNLSYMAQILLSCVTGYIVASIGLSDQEKTPAFGAVCGMACICNLALVCLDGKSHEIDPVYYKSIAPDSLISLNRLNRNCHIFWSSVIIVPMIVAILDAGLSSIWITSAKLLLVAILINLYMLAIDTLARLTLCKYKVNVKRLVEELTDDTSREFTLDAMLSIILHEDSKLIKLVSMPTRNLGTVLMEEEEVGRNREAMDTMGKTLVNSDGTVGGLESDILRALTLESLGGDAGDDGREIMSSKRHMRVVEEWVGADAKLLVAQREPLAIALVRALCAYTGGVGSALHKFIFISSKKPKTTIVCPSNYATWTFPAAAIGDVDSAITAAARFVVHSITTSSNAALDWRSGHLSMMVPVVLCASFNLRKGILRYVGVVEDHPTFATVRADTQYCRQLECLKNRCEHVAMCILQTLRSLEGLRHVTINVQNSECRAWLESMLDLDSPKPKAIEDDSTSFAFALD